MKNDKDFLKAAGHPPQLRMEGFNEVQIGQVLCLVLISGNISGRNEQKVEFH